MQITLTDTQPILDAKYRLEQVYPHILHLQYRQTAQAASSAAPTLRRAIAPDALFSEFFRQTQGRSLTTAEAALFNDVLRRASREEVPHETA